MLQGTCKPPPPFMKHTPALGTLPCPPHYTACLPQSSAWCSPILLEIAINIDCATLQTTFPSGGPARFVPSVLLHRLVHHGQEGHHAGSWLRSAAAPQPMLDADALGCAHDMT